MLTALTLSLSLSSAVSPALAAAPERAAGAFVFGQRQFLREPRSDWAAGIGGTGTTGSGPVRFTGRFAAGRATQGAYLVALMGGGLRTPGKRHAPYLLLDTLAGWGAVWGAYGGPTVRGAVGVGVPFRSGPKPRPPTGTVQVVAFAEGTVAVDGPYTDDRIPQLGVAVHVLKRLPPAR